MLSKKYAILFTNTDYSALRPLQEKKLFLSFGSFTWELDFCKETDIDQQRQRKSIDRHNLFFLGEKKFYFIGTDSDHEKDRTETVLNSYLCSRQVEFPFSFLLEVSSAMKLRLVALLKLTPNLYRRSSSEKLTPTSPRLQYIVGVFRVHDRIRGVTEFSSFWICLLNCSHIFNLRLDSAQKKKTRSKLIVRD